MFSKISFLILMIALNGPELGLAETNSSDHSERVHSLPPVSRLLKVDMTAPRSDLGTAPPKTGTLVRAYSVHSECTTPQGRIVKSSDSEFNSCVDEVYRKGGPIDPSHPSASQGKVSFGVDANSN